MTYSDNKQLNAFITAYIRAMLWSSSAVMEDPADDLESLEGFELDPSTIERVTQDCTAFYKEAFHILTHLDETCLNTFEFSGHDFWLTRNRHGTGFWDRGLGNAGDYLTALSHKAGEQDPYIGDNGKVFL
jgi:hypothetical protein